MYIFGEIWSSLNHDNNFHSELNGGTSRKKKVCYSKLMNSLTDCGSSLQREERHLAIGHAKHDTLGVNVNVENSRRKWVKYVTLQ